MEAISAALTSIAHASAVGGQGGSNNLQRFKAHHPPTFIRGGIRWWLTIGSDKLIGFWRLWRLPPTRIRLATFQLEGESQVWWD